MRPVAHTVDLGTPRSAHGHLLAVTALAVFSDGRILTGSKDCCLIIWEADSLKKLHIIKGFRHDFKGDGHSHEILSVAVSDDSQYFVSGSRDKTIKVWDAHSYTLRRTLKGHRDAVTSLRFLRHSHILFSGSADRRVKQWDVDDCLILDTLHGHHAEVLFVDVLPNNRGLH